MTRKLRPAAELVSAIGSLGFDLQHHSDEQITAAVSLLRTVNPEMFDWLSKLLAGGAQAPASLGICKCGHGEGVHTHNLHGEPKQRHDCSHCACESYVPGKRWTEVLCQKCGGNGVVKIPGGVSTCPRCDGRCYEPDVSGGAVPPPAPEQEP